MTAESTAVAEMERVPITQQIEMRICPYCGRAFEARRRYQSFCTSQHRMHYHKDFGLTARVARVTRIASGEVSVMLRFSSGPAAEHAINLLCNDVVSMVKK